MASSYDSAAEKLSRGASPFPLNDLPRRRDDSLWGEIRNEYGLTLAELSSLKNSALADELSIFSDGLPEMGPLSETTKFTSNPSVPT